MGTMRIVLLFLLLSWSGLAAAKVSFELAERALQGDLDAAEQLLDQHRDNNSVRIIAASALQTSGAHGRALALLEDAMRNGSRTALWARVVHHIEQREWIEGYAWGRLAMLIEKHDHDSEIDEEAWPLEWTWQFTQRAARNLRESEFPEADRQTEAIVGQWYGPLTAERDFDPADAPVFLERRAPIYPRDEAYARETGWSLLMLQFERDGTVSRVMPIVQTHRDFGQRAAAALEDWVIDPSSLEADDFDRMFMQTVEFSLEN